MNERDLTFPGSGLRVMHEENRISLSITDESGRSLLSIHRNGSVTGSVEDASEAGAAFVSYLRQHLTGPSLIAAEGQGEPSHVQVDQRGRHWWACAVNAPRADWVGPCDCDLSRDPSLTEHPAALRAAGGVR